MGNQQATENTDLSDDEPDYPECPVILHLYQLDDNKQEEYHSGVEVYGSEYYYGRGSGSRTGIAVQRPKSQPPQLNCKYYRSNTICKNINKSRQQVREILAELRLEWKARDYHLTKHNCHHFSDAFVKELCGDSYNIDVPGFVNTTNEEADHNYSSVFAMLGKNEDEEPDILYNNKFSRNKPPINHVQQSIAFRAEQEDEDEKLIREMLLLGLEEHIDEKKYEETMPPEKSPNQHDVSDAKVTSVVRTVSYVDILDIDKSFLTNKYDQCIVNELVKLGLGSEEQAIEASLRAVNYRDVNEVASILQKITDKHGNDAVGGFREWLYGTSERRAKLTEEMKQSYVLICFHFCDRRVLLLKSDAQVCGSVQCVIYGMHWIE